MVRRLSLIMRVILVIVTLLAVTIGSGDEVGDIVGVSALLGGTVRLPCDTSPPAPQNPLLLTVWFKDHHQDPIYR